MYLSSRLPWEVEKFVPVYKQDVVVGVTPSEEAVIVDEPLHSTQVHWITCLTRRDPRGSKGDRAREER